MTVPDDCLQPVVLAAFKIVQLDAEVELLCVGFMCAKDNDKNQEYGCA